MAGFFGFQAFFDENEPEVIQLLESSSYSEETALKMAEFAENENRSVLSSPQKLYYNNEPINVQLLNIDGYNFISLEDAAEIFGVDIHTDEDTKTVNIVTIDDPLVSLSSEELKPYIDYLKNNVIHIDLESADKDILKEANLNDYNVYLVGEHHAIAKNYDIQLYMLKYLNKHQGVKYIISEIGYCDAQMINKYLESGDASILETIMGNLKGTFSYVKELKEFYEEVYEYNKTLKDGEKLTVIGIDLQHQTYTGIDYLLSLVPDVSDIPEVIKNDVEALNSAKEDKAHRADLLNSVLESTVKNEDTYKKFMPENYEHFKRGAKNIVQLFECSSSGDMFMKAREEKIIENFMYQYEEINGSKCFGMFGGFHTILNARPHDGNGEYNFATYINDVYDKTKNKVASATVNYYECSYMDKDTGEGVKVPYATIEKMLAQTTESDFAFFPLAKKGSIFVQDGSTGSQQFMLLIKNSPNAVMYGK
ncbi:MAG TPA: hypothetical protein DCM73_10140 [Clostridiales bacterium]|nr:hypothetical protein [Clostridiales bacterium]